MIKGKCFSDVLIFHGDVGSTVCKRPLFVNVQREVLQAQRMSQAIGYYWGQQDAAEILAALGLDQVVA